METIMPDLNADAELRDYAARRDIQKLLYNYMRAQDRLLPDLHRTVFARDAYVDCGHYKGSGAGFVDFAQGFLGDIKASQHLLGQIDIDIDGDRASGEVYFLAQHRLVEEGAEKDLFVAGRYVDEYGREDGAWKIFRRFEIVDWARTDPAADGFLVAAPGLNMAGRRDEDFSTTRDWPV
jgi:hypothetical protein